MRRLLISLLLTGLAIGFLLACDLVLFRNAIADGMIYYRSDTVTYYFPIANRLMDVLREGHLLLWTPYIFGGFPLFADGEAGMLYPPNLLFYLLLPEQEAYVWLRVTRYFMAALFAFCYLTTLKLNRFAAVLGAIIFAFGSFTVTQMHHTNVVNTAIWLPLTLCMVELAVQNVRRWRWLYVTGAGASVGVQALGLHIQPLLMSGLFLAAYLPFRVLFCPIAWPAPRKGGGLLVSCLSRVLTAIWRIVNNVYNRVFDPRVKQWRQSVISWNSRPWEWPEGFWPLVHGVSSQSKRVLSRPPLRSLISVLEMPLGVATSSRWVIRVRLWFSKRALKGQSLGCWVRAGVQRSPRAVWICLCWLAGFLESSFHRVVLALLLLAGIPAIAFGIAAVQVLPLVELGSFSFRGAGVNLQFATSYSLPLQHLVNLVFPYFFRYTNRFYWSLWSEWETTLYVGIGGIVLASVAILFVRNRMVLFFALMAVASTLMAFGNYSPYPLYELLWPLPGFSSLRVPGRFTMLVTFCIAVLAAYGLDWLCRTLRPAPATDRQGWWHRLSRTAGIHGFALFLAGLAVAMAAGFWWILSFRLWIEKEPWAVKSFVEQSYLSLRSSRPWLTSDMVLSFLNYTLDPTNEKTALALGLMLATFLLLFFWFAFKWLWRVWASAVVVLVALDLLLFGLDFHPKVHINQLSNPDAAARWLMAQNNDGMARIYSTREVRKTEANKLLPFKVADITGYSSLEMTRHRQYMDTMNEFDKALLDLYNVQFIVQPKRHPALPSFEYTAYHPNRPLIDGPTSNRGAHVTFYVNPAVKTEEITIISNLRSATDILQDADVADIVVVDTRGERTTLKMKAGRDTAEWAWDRPDVKPHVGHQKTQLVDRLWQTDPGGGPRYQVNLYLAKLKLDKIRTVERIEFNYTNPKGAVRVYGMMLWHNGVAHQLLGRDRFISRYEDDEVLILENPSRLPRVFLVPTARIVDRAQTMDIMSNGDFDPEKVVLFDARSRASKRLMPDPAVPDPQVVENWLKGNSTRRPGTAEILDYRPTEIEILTKSASNAVLFMSDSYYPGWKALIDGNLETVYRVNHIFRGVLVPAGEHRVRLVFEPESFAVGTEISIFTISTLLIFWAAMLIGVPAATLSWRGVRLIRSKSPSDNQPRRHEDTKRSPL